jgi:hypothetical protein
MINSIGWFMVEGLFRGPEFFQTAILSVGSFDLSAKQEFSA